MIVLDLFDIYVLNLVVTVAMFTVLVFRAWVEHKNYKLMWRELEWRRTCETAGKILKVEGGEELYELLTNLFSNNK